MHTVAQVAAILDRPYRTVAHWCSRHGVGTLLSPRLRVLTDEDIERLRQIAATTEPGNPEWIAKRK